MQPQPLISELWKRLKLAQLSCLSRVPLGLHLLPILQAVTWSRSLESLKTPSFCTPYSMLLVHFYVCRYHGLLSAMLYFTLELKVFHEVVC